MQFNGPQSHILFVGNLWGPCTIHLHNTTKRRKVRLTTNADKVAGWAGLLETRPPPPLAALPHPLVGDPLHPQAAGARAVQGAGVAGPGPGQQQCTVKQFGGP